MYECLCDHFHAFRVMLCLPADLDGTERQHKKKMMMMMRRTETMIRSDDYLSSEEK